MTQRARPTFRSLPVDAPIRRSGVALALLLLPLLTAHECTPDTAPDDVRTLEDFVECLNHRAVNGEIADAVQCLPCGCTMTLTKSDDSAQPACSFDGVQLPRVLLDCPGPPQYMPSFSLCVTDPGLTRVEIGQVINNEGHMRMADVHVDPPGYPVTDPSSVVSKVDSNSLSGDSKECWQCHESIAAAEGQEAISKPEPYEIFGPECVIDTDAAGEKPDAGNCNNEEQVTAESLASICQKIDEGVNQDGHPFDTDEGRLADHLCEALMNYRATRGVCGSEECPPPTGPACDDLGEDCDPYDSGATAAMATGYSCQEVAEGEGQCVSSRSCVEYSLTGGGKFLTNGEVSFVRLEASGRAAVEGDGILCDSTDITAELSAFNHAANMLVEGAQLASLTADDQGGGDFTAEGDGSGTVDGVGANLHFEVGKASGSVTFDVEDSDTATSLAGGTGEAGRADFELTETPAP
jgi:hypothetical protein